MLGQVKIVVVALVAVALVVFGVFAYDYIGDKAVAKYVAAQKELQLEANTLKQEKYDRLSEDYEKAKAQKEIVYKTLTNTVERIVKEPAYQEPCITQEGLEVANKALKGAIP